MVQSGTTWCAVKGFNLTGKMVILANIVANLSTAVHFRPADTDFPGLVLLPSRIVCAPPMCAVLD
jgi:hypothetical protein